MRRVVIAALAVLGLTGCSLGTPAETPPRSRPMT